jgi:hypothetical protein
MSTPIQVVQVTLTSSQILAMGSNPNLGETLVAAQGAGIAIIPIQVIAQYTSGSVAYLNVNGNAAFNVAIQSGSALTTCFSTPVTGFLTSSGGSTNRANFLELAAIEIFKAAISDITNQPLVAQISNTVTTGNGSMTLTIFYVTLTPA